MARVGGEPGWPTLYGKRDRRTDHPIVNHPPQIHFLPMERLHACRWAEGGRTTPRAGVAGGLALTAGGTQAPRGPPGPTGGGAPARSAGHGHIL
ncbi:hypothetical protein BO70DRAFT_367202, partial [Aspergillus heteromorphus CBS 117.55]